MALFSVFGGRGRIGSDVVKYLSDDDDQEVRIISRKLRPEEWGDLGHVVFAAGLTADFRERPFDTMRAHVGLIGDLLDKGRFRSLVYLSSTRLYQNSLNTQVESDFRVNPANPGDLYTLSKLSGEALCLQADQTVRVARLSNVVGPAEIGQATFLGQILSEAKSGHIRLRTALSSEKDYVWLRDASSCLVRIASGGTSRIYNVASGENLSHKAWTDALKKEFECRVSVCSDARPVVHTPIDISRTRSDLGFEPSPVLPMIAQICTQGVD